MALSGQDREVGHAGTVEVVVKVGDAEALAETSLARLAAALAACAISGRPGRAGSKGIVFA
jgi:hypothetical protein